jgi:RNA recognition motif-containing protein
VQLDSIISAERAINAMHLQVFHGRRVTVYYAMTSLIRTDKQWKPSDTIYVGNMPFDTTDRELQQLVASLQNVIDVRVNMDRRTGQFRGFIHIQFLNVESAMVALEKLANPELHGRKLKVLYTHRRKDSNTHQEARES